VYRVVWRYKRQYPLGQLLVEEEQSVECLHDGLVLDMHVVGRFLASLQSRSRIVQGVLQVGYSSLDAIRRDLNRLNGRARLRCGGLGKGVFPVDESVSAGATLDLSKADEVAALEVAVAVLEFPERRFGVAGMKHVSFCIHGKPFEVRRFEAEASGGRRYLYGIRTC
jgi:hypothetical protein